MHITDVTKKLVKRYLWTLKKLLVKPVKIFGLHYVCPKRECLRSTVAGHLPIKWNEVSSPSIHTGHKAYVRVFITLRCVLSIIWPVTSPTSKPSTHKSHLLRLRAKCLWRLSFVWATYKHLSLSTSCGWFPHNFTHSFSAQEQTSFDSWHTETRVAFGRVNFSLAAQSEAQCNQDPQYTTHSRSFTTANYLQYQRLSKTDCHHMQGNPNHDKVIQIRWYLEIRLWSMSFTIVISCHRWLKIYPLRKFSSPQLFETGFWTVTNLQLFFIHDPVSLSLSVVTAILQVNLG